MPKDLVTERDGLKASIIKCKQWTNSMSGKTIAELNAVLDKLNEKWNSFKAIHSSIIDVTGSSELPFQTIEFSNCEEVYKSSQAILVEAIKNLREKTAKAASGSAINIQPTSHVDLIGGNNLKISIAEQGLLRVQNWANQATIENSTLNVARGHLGLLDQYWKSFMDASHLENDPAAMLALHKSIAEKELLFINTKATLEELVMNFTPAAAPVPVNNRINAEIKLPCIELPKFNGNYESWTSFFDLFTSLVDNNQHLSGSQKLHYLKSSVEGDAALLIRSYNITDANYIEAWRALQARYQNQRLIANSHLKNIVELQKLKVESASGLRRSLDSFSENIRALTALGRPTDQWDDLLVYMFVDSMDSETRRFWELSLADEMPTFEQLRTFVEKRCRSLEAAGITHKSTSTTRNAPFTQFKPRTLIGTSDTSSSPSCQVCNENHQVFACPQFHQLDVGQRLYKAIGLGLCFNCLRGGHLANICTAGPCRSCQGRHHTLLHHQDKIQSPNPSVNLNVNSWNTEVLLSTASILVQAQDHSLVQAKALLDSGSQASFITERFFRKLQLVRKKASIPICGLGKTSAGISRGYANLNLQSNTDDKIQFNVDVLIMECITKRIPYSPVDKSKLAIPFDIKLADPNFNIPSDVDILLGSDVYGTIFLDGVRQTYQGITARKTIFGWVLSGPIIEPTNSLHYNTPSPLCSHITLEQTLKKFWELETIEIDTPLTSDEQKCEQIFNSTHSRDQTGRYIVRLPFNLESPPLGNSKRSALSSLASLEKRFTRQPGLRKEYSAFIHEYASLGHMELCDSECEDQNCFYLPHHPVFKQSTTTKIRVVFDASRQTQIGPSLNDKLLVGPKLQDDLVDILTRFRTHKYAFTSDIAKMYRQILVEKEQWDFQRILWRDSEHDKIECYRLKTVTYGTASASYLATKALQQLALDEAQSYPLASRTALSDFYVDDVMSGSDDLAETLKMQTELIALMNAGGMQLRKWASNCDSILQAVPPEHRECSTPLEIHHNEFVKTLGLIWYPNHDQFGFKVDLDKQLPTLTKRIVLSQASKLFDPLGLLAPVIIYAKIFMQQLWIDGIDWDEKLSADMTATWERYRNELPLLNDLKITRWFGRCTKNSAQIHGFCDASEVAYGAVVYLRTKSLDGHVRTNLVASKTRVAPVKKVCIPRLELCGASLLSKLLEHVRRSLSLQDAECFAWTDSTVVLAWIRKPSHHWKTFVANRVSEIQTLTSPLIWRHVPGTDNPADRASRGIFPSDIIDCSLWWNGPQWLTQESDRWPARKMDCKTNIDEKAPNISLVMSLSCNPVELMEKYSSVGHLKRITAYLLRFASNCRAPKSKRQYGTLSNLDLSQALNCWIKVVQGVAFGIELKDCEAGRSVNAKSSLKSLNPFLDSDGLLKVGGRLEAAQIPYERKHPIILPKKSHLINLLVSDCHTLNLHSGIQLTLCTLRQRYWIIGARTTVRACIHRCVTCIRHRKSPGTQLMGNLPAQRLAPTRPFLTCGVDYAGPLTLRLHAGRCNRTTKAYIALFVCFSTKALHLELVSDLTSNAFLASFRRFTSRRGKCSDIYSDCGTNFVGAQKELRELHAAVMSQLSDPSLARSLASEGTNWHFNPPGAPHMGGIWEAGVKSVKHHLRRIVGTTPMTFEEATTVLTQIEAVLNSRPICPLKDDPDDFEVLTPGHFLIGEPLNSLPDPGLEHLAISRLSRWQMCQKLVRHFWNRWRNEYLNSLQQRTKWFKTKDNVEVGQLALVIDDNQPPANWTLGRVVEMFTGKDGLVRVVNLKHKNGFMKRPISKICPFPKM